jgi:hypothetical protein
LSDVENNRRREVGQAEKREETTIGVIMATYEGRWWMSDLLERCSLFTALYRGDNDAMGMAWRDGRADIGRFLLAQIDGHTPELYARMMRERRTRLEKQQEKVEEVRRKLRTDEVLPQETPAEAMLLDQERFYREEQDARARQTPKGTPHP